MAVAGNWYWLKNYPVTVTYTRFSGISVGTTESAAAIYNGTIWQEYNPPVDALVTTISNKLDTLTTRSPNLVDTSFLKARQINPNGTYGSASNNWISLDKTAITPNTPYTLGGLITSISASVVRIMFYKANGTDTVGNAVIVGNGTNANDVSFTSCSTCYFMTSNIASGSNVGINRMAEAKSQVSLNVGLSKDPVYNVPGLLVKNERVLQKPKEVWWNPTTGNDANNGGINSPFLTQARANSVVDPNGRIFMAAGDYNLSTLPLSQLPAGGLNGAQNARVRIFVGANLLTGFTKTSGLTNVYQIAYTGAYNSLYYLWQHDTSDTRSVIIDTARCAFDNGKTYRLGSTKLINGVSTVDLDTSFNSGNFKWYLDDPNDILYVAPVTTNFISYPIVVPNINAFVTNTAQNRNIALTGIEFQYCSVNFSRTSATVNHCKFMYSNLEGNCKWDNSYNININFCEAAGSRNDGFNAHYTTTPVNKFATLNAFILNGVYAHDNGDDGISTHEYSNGLITNSVISFNDQGGTPASGAHWTVNNCIFYKNRGNGLVAQGSAIDGGFGTQITANGCFSAYNSINYSGQGSGKTSTFNNCISKYAGTIYFGSGAEYNNPIRLPVPVFTDNATAISGGLFIGERYRTGEFLKIVY